MKTIKHLIVLCLVTGSATAASAQSSTGEIHGRIYDNKSKGETAIGVLVWTESNGDLLKTQSDDDGRFILKPLNAGKYNVLIKSMDRVDTLKYQVEVLPNEITRLAEVNLVEEATEMTGIVVSADPLIHVDQPAVVRMNAKQLEHIPIKRDLKALLTMMTTDVKTVGTSDAYIRGSRADAVLYIVDGVKQSDRVTAVPGSAINNIMVYTGGVPAKYGDCTGGVVVVETKSYYTLYYDWLANH